MKKKVMQILTIVGIMLALGLIVLGALNLNIVLIGAGTFVLIMDIKELRKVKTHD
jgi:hypothetical protein